MLQQDLRAAGIVAVAHQAVHGAFVKTVDGVGKHIADGAVFEGIVMVLILLAHGVIPQGHDRNGLTVLHGACQVDVITLAVKEVQAETFASCVQIPGKAIIACQETIGKAFPDQSIRQIMNALVIQPKSTNRVISSS